VNIDGNNDATRNDPAPGRDAGGRGHPLSHLEEVAQGGDPNLGGAKTEAALPGNMTPSAYGHYLTRAETVLTRLADIREGLIREGAHLDVVEEITALGRGAATAIENMKSARELRSLEMSQSRGSKSRPASSDNTALSPAAARAEKVRVAHAILATDPITLQEQDSQFRHGSRPDVAEAQGKDEVATGSPSNPPPSPGGKRTGRSGEHRLHLPPAATLAELRNKVAAGGLGNRP
jgi:hypothetical protein